MWEFIFEEKGLFEISENKNLLKITSYTVLTPESAQCISHYFTFKFAPIKSHVIVLVMVLCTALLQILEGDLLSNNGFT